MSKVNWEKIDKKHVRIAPPWSMNVLPTKLCAYLQSCVSNPRTFSSTLLYDSHKVICTLGDAWVKDSTLGYAIASSAKPDTLELAGFESDVATNITTLSSPDSPIVECDVLYVLGGYFIVQYLRTVDCLPRNSLVYPYVTHSLMFYPAIGLDKASCGGLYSIVHKDNDNSSIYNVRLLDETLESKKQVDMILHFKHIESFGDLEVREPDLHFSCYAVRFYTWNSLLSHTTKLSHAI